MFFFVFIFIWLNICAMLLSTYFIDLILTEGRQPYSVLKIVIMYSTEISGGTRDCNHASNPALKSVLFSSCEIISAFQV
jgi:hypothetical protein